jgi:hypothetical protein
MTVVTRKKLAEAAPGTKRILRILVVCDDDQNLTMASTLRFSGDSVLISAGIRLKEGTKITLEPVCDLESSDLGELTGVVVKSYENVLTSAFAKDRFMMGVQLDLDDLQLQIIQDLLRNQGEDLSSGKRGERSQDTVLDSAVWRVR